MANGRFLGVAAAALAATIPTLADEGTLGGKSRAMYDSYTLLADLAAGDQINMGPKIPQGAILTNCKIAVPTGLGGSCTINVGWLAGNDIEPAAGGGQTEQAQNLTGFFSALPVSSATYASAFGSAYQGNFYLTRLTSAVQVVISENAVSSGATGDSITCEVNYIVD